MTVPPPPRAAVPALAAVAGVVAAHTVDYLVAFPHAGQRAAQLHGSGHGYWPVAVGAAVAAAAVALILVSVSGVGRAAAAGTRPPAFADFGWVLAWQVGAFVVMEAGERAVVGVAPSVLLASPVFWLGLLLQLPVAWLSTRMLRVVEHVAFRLAAHLGRRPVPPVRRLPVPPQVLVPTTPVPRSPARPRAPPLALAD